MTGLSRCFAVLTAATVSAQPSPRRATNIAALQGVPAFFHLRPVVVMGKVSLADDGELRVTDEAGVAPHRLQGQRAGRVERSARRILGSRPDERRRSATRRLSTSSGRFASTPRAAWPRPGQVTAIVASAIAEAQPPDRHVDSRHSCSIRRATSIRRCRSPDSSPVAICWAISRTRRRKSRYDFVVRSADAAIWVTNLRPRGKDFELALDARIDTGRWVQLSGVLQQGRGLQWLDAHRLDHRVVEAAARNGRRRRRFASRPRRRPKWCSARRRRTRPTS